MTKIIFSMTLLLSTYELPLRVTTSITVYNMNLQVCIQKIPIMHSIKYNVITKATHCVV